MPKAILEFDLPEDTNQFEQALKGAKYISVIQALDNELRNLVKYAPDEVPKEVTETYSKCRKKLHEFCRDEDFSVWDI